MNDLEALKNRGLVSVGPAVATGPKTLVVVGVGRGGTSIVAGALATLGVFMGDRAGPPVFEDVRLAEAMETADEPGMRAIIAEYNLRQAVWGFKRPSVVQRLSAMHGLFRNPVYLFVFRDILSVANRNVLSMRAELLPSLREPLEGYRCILDFIEQTAPTGLLISTEKAMLHRELLVGRLAELAGLPPGARAQQAVDFIQADPLGYLDQSRLKFKGTLECATPEFVSGWAFVGNRAGPATVVIRVDGTVVGKTVAALLRPDLREHGLHPTGACGFRFRFPEQKAPAPGDSVAVEFELGGDALARSPRPVEPAPSASVPEDPATAQ